MKNTMDNSPKNTPQEDEDEDFLLGAEPPACGINDEECESCQ